MRSSGITKISMLYRENTRSDTCPDLHINDFGGIRSLHPFPVPGMDAAAQNRAQAHLTDTFGAGDIHDLFGTYFHDSSGPCFGS